MATKIELIQKTQSPRSALRKIIWASPLSMLIATVANLGLYAAAGSLFPEVAAWSGAGPAQIVGANIVYLTFGTIVFALMARFSFRPARHFLITATIGLILSLGLPISAVFGYGAPGVPAASMATAVTLSLMHIISYAISVPLFINLALD